MTKIVFGIMSAVAKVDTVAQLTQHLEPQTVVIHHDYSQQPDFRIDQPHVNFVPNPRRTGYGSWVWPAGILHLLQYCVDHVDFDYFQLLSPSCLPIRPISEFTEHVANCGFDAHAEFMSLAERDVMMYFGPRAFTPDKSLRRVVLRHARSWYLSDDASLVERSGLQVFSPRLTRNGSLSLRARAAVALVRMANRPPFAVLPPEGTARLFIGGPWFGAKREVCEYLLKFATDPEWLRYFQSVNDIGELVFATILGNSPYRIGPFNHYVSTYKGWHPRWLAVNDIETLAATGRFFARKFPDDPDADVRRQLLGRIAHQRPLRQAHQ